jgi:hypothetical protein
VPENDGVAWFDSDGGWLSVTAGGSVSISKVAGALLPVPMPVFSAATTV